MHILYKTIEKLNKNKIHFILSNNRENIVTLSVAVPGQRIEIDVHSDENVDIAVFKGNELASTNISHVDFIINSFNG